MSVQASLDEGRAIVIDIGKTVASAIRSTAQGVIGWLWAPRNEGKSLEALEAERQAD